MLNNVRKTIGRYGLISPGDHILAGVSGGPDSLAMLYALQALRKELNLTLHIGHLDHMLRSESPKDALFVKKLGDKFNIPVSIKAIDLKSRHSKGSIEESGRTERFNFLIKLAKKIKADKIALGHNLDDQAETVLMRVLRGTGLYGLGGILPKREIGGICFIRPLIEIKRQDIEAFLKPKTIKPRIDKTNFEDIYFRNRIRHYLLPILEAKFNPGIKNVLANLAQSSSQDYDYLKKTAGRILKARRSGLALKPLVKLHPAMLNMVIRRQICGLQGNTRRISFQHIKEIEDMLFNRPTGSIVHLPKGVKVRKTPKSLHFFIG